MTACPVYLKAIPRSGGTLFVTLLDAHPSIAMSYEIYEELLTDEKGAPLDANQTIAMLEVARAPDDVRWIKRLGDRNLRTFLLRARRGGLVMSEILQAWRNFAADGGSFGASRGRQEFIDTLMRCKASKFGKTTWGGKTSAELCTLHDRHEGAAFFIMVRDIRDVFASMLGTGSFKYTAREAAALWKTRILEFREFVTRRQPKALEIRYERLAAEPEAVLRDACELIGIAYSPEMLSYHTKEMTLFKNPHGHLSNEKLQKGINRSSIGRWRDHLPEADVRQIMSVAGDMLDD